MHLTRYLTLGTLNNNEPFDVNDLVAVLMLAVNLHAPDLNGNLVPAMGIASRACPGSLQDLRICLRNDDELVVLTYLHHFNALHTLYIEFTTHVDDDEEQVLFGFWFHKSWRLHLPSVKTLSLHAGWSHCKRAVLELLSRCDIPNLQELDVSFEPRYWNLAHLLSDVCSRFVVPHISLDISTKHYALILPRLQAASVAVRYSHPSILKYIRPFVKALRIDLTRTGDGSLFRILQILSKTDSTIEDISISSGGSRYEWRWLPPAESSVFMWPSQGVRDRLLRYVALLSPKRIHLRDGFGKLATDYRILRALVMDIDISVIEEEEADEEEDGNLNEPGDTSDEDNQDPE
jgi:hypothetical protein